MSKIKKLTFKRTLNAAKIYAAYAGSILWDNTFRPAYPVSLSVEPVAGCNLTCPQCPVGMKNLERPEGQIDFSLFKKITDETAPYISAMILYFQGEPYMSKNFFKCVNYASHTKNIYTISSTNAHFLNEKNSQLTLKSGLDELIISLDGISKQTYTAYRKGGSLELVLENIQRFMSLRKAYSEAKPKVILQSLLLSSNLHEQDQLKNFAKSVGVDKYKAKKAQFYNYEKGNSLMPKDERYSRYKQDDKGNTKIKTKLRNRCKRLWDTAVITWDGEVLPCCFDKSAKYSFGNIREQSFKEINNNELARNFRKNLRKNRSAIKICRNCSEP